jgi:hypothetical protein
VNRPGELQGRYDPPVVSGEQKWKNGDKKKKKEPKVNQNANEANESSESDTEPDRAAPGPSKWEHVCSAPNPS